MMPRLRSILFFSALTLAGPAWSDCADLALVLAIDGSGSIGMPEFAFQQAGYAAAFQNDRVLRALSQAGQVDVAVVVWGDSEMTPQILPWMRISGPADAQALSGALAMLPRTVTGSTGIGNGLWTALDLIAAPGQCAPRRIVNISGDGVESRTNGARNFIPLIHARNRAERMGVTVNGLAIETSPGDLRGWYETQVITGDGAFVIDVSGFDSFADGLVRKLAREIAPAQISSLQPEKRAGHR